LTETPLIHPRATQRFGLAILAILMMGSATYAQDFAKDVQPIFAERCVRCHGEKRQEGGLRLDVRRRAMQGGDTGLAISPKESAKSEIVQRITSTVKTKRMPPTGPLLTNTEIDLIRTWIDRGAAWPDALAGKESFQDHWAFRPVQRPTPPAVKSKDRVHNPIDAFILGRLEKNGLTLSPDADRPTLIRRLYLDLIGLPPSPDDVERFVKDDRSNAYEQLVDTLLDSRHFGERWGRHWLDLARFAESDGYENDRLRKDAWRYRDWVVDSFNRDMPFDQFTVEQLAGDLLPKPTTDQLIAVGLHRNTLWNSAASADKEEFRTLAIKDRTDTTGTAWMGLTLGCAKCHSHKYDPISQREYYQLYAFFNNTDNDDVKIPGDKAQAQSLRAVQRDTFVHQRGNFLQRGVAVKPGTPAFMPALKPSGASANRLDLARWLVTPEHPLTARVAVNHFWLHLFGQPLVPASDNFGLNGEPPTHPELLDWLASEFVRGKWSRKAILKTIVLSATYRQASKHRPELAKVDPNNRLLARQNRVRVEAEIVRDLALAVSGLLDPKLGGPSIVPPFPAGLLEQNVTNEGLKLPTKEHHRRGIYIHVQRTLTHPSLAAFDVADGNQCSVQRERSVTPIQALTLLNDPVFVECSQALGKRLCTATAEREDRLRLGFQLCLGRSPSAAELAVLVELVQAQQKFGATDEATWAGVARTLINLEKFITRE